MTACPRLAAFTYLYRHNLVTGALHWHLLKVYSIPSNSKSWFTHRPPPAIETSQVKIWWNFSLESDHHHLSNCPDVIVFDYLKQLILFIEVLCPADVNVPSKEQEKLHKYCPLALDLHLMMPVQIVLVVFGCTGVVSADCLTHLHHLPGFSDRLFNMQH